MWGTPLTTFNPTRLRHEFHAVDVFIIIWLASMIALPILRWIVGDIALTAGVILTTLFQFSAVAFAVSAGWGWPRTLRVIALVAVVTYTAEFVGSRSGLPFGRYHYTDLLQPQLAGVPLLIPLAWFMMLPPAWAIAQQIACHRWQFYIISAAAFTAWDFFLDPQNVAWGLWVWTDSTGGYFGIPWLNYGGWFLVSLLVTMLVRPTDLPMRPLMLIYGIVWLFQTIGQVFFWNLPGPGIVGFAAMGLFVLLAWWRSRKQ